MSFASEASKLLTNQYFLYFIVFLAVTNVMGYLVTNKINAVAFFILVCILMYNFSKNMTVVLIVAIVATNLLMVNKSMREGMENETDVTTTDTTATTEGATEGATDTTATTEGDTTDDVAATTSTTVTKPTLAQKAKTEKQTLGAITPNTKSQIKTAASSAVAAKKSATPTTTTTDTTTTVDENGETVPVETFAPAGAGFSGNKRGAIGGPMKASRIDYSTTLEQAYENLDKMIGGDGLQNLSADTERLMNQQQKLFGAVEKMLPMIDKAQGMIQGLDMTKINSLIGMTDKIGGISGNLGNGLNKLMGAPVGN